MSCVKVVNQFGFVQDVSIIDCFFEILIGWNCQTLCICLMLLLIRSNFFPFLSAAVLHQYLTRQILFFFLVSFQTGMINFHCSVGIRLTGISKTCICLWFFLRFHLISLQNYRVDCFQQCLSGQFHLCVSLLLKHFPEYFLCIRPLMG